MTIFGVLLRFIWIYVSVLLVAAYSMIRFGFHPTAFNFVELMFCVVVVCGIFADRNGRYFTKKEKITLFFGIMAFDCVMTSILALAPTIRSTTNIIYLDIFSDVGFVSAIHAAFVYLAITLAQKLLIKLHMING